MSLKLKYNITEWPQWKLNYVGIPKCGNTMMKWYLLGQPPVVSLLDSNAELHREQDAKYITPAQANANGYRTFALIRNPLERVFSMWKDFHGKRDGLLGQRGMTFYDFVTQVVVSSDDTENTNVHLRSMHYFIKDIKEPWLIPLECINEYEGSELRKMFGIDSFQKLHTTKKLQAPTEDTEIGALIIKRYPEDWKLYKNAMLPPSFRAM